MFHDNHRSPIPTPNGPPRKTRPTAITGYHAAVSLDRSPLLLSQGSLYRDTRDTVTHDTDAGPMALSRLDYQDTTNVDEKGIAFTIRSVFVIDPKKTIRTKRQLSTSLLLLALKGLAEDIA
ncbi:hypothetical protein VM1G_11755 [Cytospora mali]|uniref:Uncharacterized protein n=1 Tax=Cytospora mali TaxID=578113 RepID=A0A194W5Q1_CYTMA|nr:hypothetical protein VM1G_11755 [Valsa mali]